MHCIFADNLFVELVFVHFCLFVCLLLFNFTGGMDSGHGGVDTYCCLLDQRNQFKIAFYFLNQNSEDLDPWHKNLS